jgi:hypothetical protein
MAFYIVNENVTPEELSAIKEAVPGGDVQIWPDGDIILPADTAAGILIVRMKSTVLEEQRAINLTGAALRIICLYLENIADTSEVSQKYCSARVAIGDGALGEALKGNDRVQQDADGASAARNRQKPHNC